MTTARKDLVSGAALLAIALIYYAASSSILDTGLADEIGARGLPTVLAALLALVALAIMLRGLVPAAPDKLHAGKEEEPEAPPLRALGLLVIGALYIPAANFLGYIPALFLLLLGVALYEGARPGWRVLAIAACGTGFFWLLFVALLGVAQPEGSLF